MAVQHYPECLYDWRSSSPHCTCSIIVAAYKRGRKDAARDAGAYAIEVVVYKHNNLETADYLHRLWLAALGEKDNQSAPKPTFTTDDILTTFTRG